MAPPAVRETLKEGRDRSIKHTDGEINVSIEIKCYYYRPKKWRMTPLKRPLGQICIFWGILAAARSIKLRVQLSSLQCPALVSPSKKAPRLDPHSLQGAAGAVEAGPQLVLVVS